MRPFLLLTVFLASFASSAFASGSGRLSRDVLPVGEKIKLNLDARKKSYSGSATIDLRATTAVDSFQFHSEGLTLSKVTLRRGAVAIPTTFAQVAPTTVTVHSKTPLKVGAYTLEVAFTNNFNEQAQGLYRMDTEGQSYCFSQFEADDARKAFPCWDEPSFKIPFQLTLVIPNAHRAVANTPIARTIPGKLTKTVVFRTTKPMPSYILAIATGPLEFVPIHGMSVPGNIVTVKGKSRLAARAAVMAPPILAALERYFGRKYPYEKLDLLAVPEFWPGAMENAGAITFRDEVLLVDPKTVGVRQLSTLSVYMAHEMAHQWFGDLVTMDWWDDLWLNESFAEWMGNKISDEVNPEYNQHVSDLHETERAMFTDSRLSTRAIRRPVNALDNLLEAADDLAYKKGQSVLRMFEGWLGPEVFQAGVRQYIHDHEWGNTVASDLWDALSKASGKHATTAMSGFLDQEGIPIVTADLLPDGKVMLSQRRFLTYGVIAPKEQLWQIPVALRYSDGTTTHTQHVLLTEPRMTVPLEGGHTPVWIHPNADASGYYRWSVSTEMLNRLAADGGPGMTPVERIGYMGNLTALLAGGQIHGDEYARLVAKFSDDPSPEVIGEVMAGIGTVRTSFVTKGLEDAYAGYVRKTLGPALTRFGLTKRERESASVSLMRPALILYLADDGKDASVMAFADSLARAHLDAPGSVDPSLIQAALQLHAIHGNEALFSEYKKRFETAEIPAERVRYLNALGYFRDPKLADEALRYSLTGPLRPQELFTIPTKQAEALEYEDAPFKWMSENFGTIASKMPPMYMIYMPLTASGCSLERLEKAKAFFADPAHLAPGADKELAKVADQVTDCAGLRQRDGALVATYLQQQVGSR